ncbi:MAG TPA: GMC family oxidoreductase [Thermoleophilaceae bacterium]
MILDLRSLEGGARIEADLCLVGSGAAGIALARELMGSSRDVVLVESGGRGRSADTEALNEGEAEGMDAEDLRSGRARVLGGATALWAGQCLPLEDGAFTSRSWVPHSGWPLERAELDPYYRRAEELFDIEGESYDERVWRRFGIAPPAFDPALLGHRFTVWCPEPHLGRRYRRDLERAGRLRVLLNATTTRIETEGAGFSALRVSTPEGKEATVRARACVLCAGGIENARLLLLSDLGAHGAGAFFQDHANGHVGTIETREPRKLQDLFSLFYRRGKRYLPRLTLSPELQRSNEVLGCAAYPVFDFGEHSGLEAARRLVRELRGRRRPKSAGEDLRRVLRDSPRLAAVGYRRLRRGRSPALVPERITLQLHAEQAPNPASRVVLSNRRDQLGLPMAKVEWKLTELDHRTAELMAGTVGEELARLGLGRLRLEPWLGDSAWSRHMNSSYHHMGTTRMSASPENGVVDPDCMVHGVDQLFVAGSSTFPAAGFANPTLTIAALAIRLADHLKRVLL